MNIMAYKLKILSFVCFALLGAGYSNAQRAISNDLSRLESFLTKPDQDQIDLLEVKLAVDRLIDPNLDAEAVRTKVDNIASSIMSLVPPNTSSVAKAMAMKRYLYERGPWNNYQIFEYDFSDPAGSTINSKLLHRYLDTKKGNCVSMPILVVILGQKLGLDITLAKAPLHYFAKYKVSETGKVYSIEATSGGHFVKDAYYIQKMGISKLALTNNLYLKKLTSQETAAAMVSLLGEYLILVDEFKGSIKAFELELKYSPRSAFAMVKIGHAYSRLIDKEFTSRYQRMSQLSAEQKSTLAFYNRKNHEFFNRAEALGWRDDARPLHAIN